MYTTDEAFLEELLSFYDGIFEGAIVDKEFLDQVEEKIIERTYIACEYIDAKTDHFENVGVHPASNEEIDRLSESLKRADDEILSLIRSYNALDAD